MALIAKSEEFIIITAQRSIFVWNTKQQTHTLTQVPKITRKNVDTTGYANANNGKQVKNDNNDEENADDDQGNVEFGSINRLAISPSNQLVVVSTLGDKFLFLYKLTNGTLNLLQNLQLARVTGTVRFTPDSKHLLIADKTGDCTIFDCENQSNNETKWILGHLSIVLDVLMTEDLKYVISSDRDEKIRVTNYPLTEVIESYCLGHSEFVSAIEELKTETNERILVSISGDRTLRLWNYVEGKELFRLELTAPGWRLARNSQNELAAVLFDENFSIGIYEFKSNENKPELRLLAEHALNENVKHIGSIVYESNDSIWYSGLDENSEVILRRLQITRSDDKIKITETDLDKVLNILKENLPSTKLQQIEDIAQLFKSRIDSTVEYHERKKKRLEQNHEKRYAKLNQNYSNY